MKVFGGFAFNKGQDETTEGVRRGFLVSGINGGLDRPFLRGLSGVFFPQIHDGLDCGSSGMPFRLLCSKDLAAILDHGKEGIRFVQDRGCGFGEVPEGGETVTKIP